MPLVTRNFFLRYLRESYFLMLLLIEKEEGLTSLSVIRYDSKNVNIDFDRGMQKFSWKKNSQIENSDPRYTQIPNTFLTWLNSFKNPRYFLIRRFFGYADLVATPIALADPLVVQRNFRLFRNPRTNSQPTVEWLFVVTGQ